MLWAGSLSKDIWGSWVEFIHRKECSAYLGQLLVILLNIQNMHKITEEKTQASENMLLCYFSKAYIGQRNEIGTKGAIDAAVPAFVNVVGPAVCVEHMYKWTIEAILILTKLGNWSEWNFGILPFT